MNHRPSTYHLRMRTVMMRLQAAIVARFGSPEGIRVYADSSDGDEGWWDACLQYRDGPGPEGDWLKFPRKGGVLCRETKPEALEALLGAILDPNRS